MQGTQGIKGETGKKGEDGQIVSVHIVKTLYIRVCRINIGLQGITLYTLLVLCILWEGNTQLVSPTLSGNRI